MTVRGITMNKISASRLIITFALTRLSAEMIIIPGELIRYGSDRFWALLFAKLAALILYIPAVLITVRFKGDNFFTAAFRRNKLFAFILGGVFSVGVGATVINTVLNLQMYISDTLLQTLLITPAVLIILAAAGYGAYKGFNAVTGSAIFAAGFYILLMVLIAVTSGDKAEFTYLYPAFIEDRNYFIKALLAEISCHSEILIFAVICNRVAGKPGKVLYSLAVTLVLTELTNLLYNLVLGPYLDEVEYPLYLIASLSDIVIFQRLDGIDAIVWIFAAVIKAALLIGAVVQIYRDGAEKPKSNLFLICYCAVLAAVGIILAANRPVFDLFERVMNSAAVLIVTGTVIPLLSLIFGKKKESASSEN